MTADDRLRAAVAAGVVGSESAYAELLRSVAEVARAIFGARAASIFLLDEATDELVFEAVVGEGDPDEPGGEPDVPLLDVGGQVLEQHRGAIQFDSAGQRGTVVTCFLPIAR